MKLIIQIPCFNEAEVIQIALAQLPREVEGFDTVEWLLIDDGSTDSTVEIGIANGVDHVASHTSNRGLAKGFMTGITACLEYGADVIVNTDADNQYCAADIPQLVKPILNGTADLVVGTRPISQIEHFSPLKKILQRVGSWVTRVASQTEVSDAPSGFRAISRSAAEQLMVFNDYSYTLETIIQAGQKNLAVTSVPVRVNEDLRPSRLVKSTASYVKKSATTIVRIFIVYRPFLFFGTIGGVLLTLGLIGALRFLYFYMIGEGDGHIQSVILSAGLIFAGFQTLLVAFLADLLAANRKLLEDIRSRQIKDSNMPD